MWEKDRQWGTLCSTSHVLLYSRPFQNPQIFLKTLLNIIITTLMLVLCNNNYYYSLQNLTTSPPLCRHDRQRLHVGFWPPSPFPYIRASLYLQLLQSISHPLFMTFWPPRLRFRLVFFVFLFQVRQFFFMGFLFFVLISGIEHNVLLFRLAR